MAHVEQTAASAMARGFLLMHASIAEPVVLERIGHTLDDTLEDILTEPLSAPIREALSPEHQPNILSALILALAHGEHFEIVERDGELFVVLRAVSVSV
jgi:hypothetical protein